jgi:hypothetical protein
MMTAQQQQQGRQGLNVPKSPITITQQQKKARVQKGRKKLLKSKKFFKPQQYIPKRLKYFEILGQGDGNYGNITQQKMFIQNYPYDEYKRDWLQNEKSRTMNYFVYKTISILSLFYMFVFIYSLMTIHKKSIPTSPYLRWNLALSFFVSLFGLLLGYFWITSTLHEAHFMMTFFGIVFLVLGIGCLHQLIKYWNASKSSSSSPSSLIYKQYPSSIRWLFTIGFYLFLGICGMLLFKDSFSSDQEQQPLVSGSSYGYGSGSPSGSGYQLV